MKPRRALFTCSDKTGIVELATALSKQGCEIVATGGTAETIAAAGIDVTPVEKLTKLRESFKGRMKTLSFHICAGILFRRGDALDEKDFKELNIPAIDVVVVNFYPFVKTLALVGGADGYGPPELIEQIDIGGPTLVRAAAKNAEHVLVLTSPTQYSGVIDQLNASGSVSRDTMTDAARMAWDHVSEYDLAIAQNLGMGGREALRYGENPHQKAWVEVAPNSPVEWNKGLTPTEISFNNILDAFHAYELMNELVQEFPDHTGVVIVKHNNPCGVALIKKSVASAQKIALERAWEGDPVSAFGGVLVFSDPLEADVGTWLSEKFVELVIAPGLSKDAPVLKQMLTKRKNLKALAVKRFSFSKELNSVTIPGGKLIQSQDSCVDEKLKSVTDAEFPESKMKLAQFGIKITKQLKSNSISLVREIPSGFQLVGAGQGQPNRIEALKWLAIPRAQSTLERTSGSLSDCVMVSDAFFPFRDTVDTAASLGLKYIVQPGGSIKDGDSITACNEHKISMAFTGRRHFKH
ncbi:MAG: bifunctional phosphoribosylaminoimidazolecarboxamide formyltransferase/IMP cyclohydrolase [Xanthomonadaceae bacterium]|nr:bifunctional phosphoribosylaminoimidazolecarboxamide formyltransferase/IMP cyclohydrolase [Xanthomonadaceae bacterium]